MNKPNNKTWYHGSKTNLSAVDNIKPLYLTPEKSLANLHAGKTGYNNIFTISDDAKWLNLDKVEHLTPSMDAIGYSEKWIKKLKEKGWDVVWDSEDYYKGFEQIFVLNPDILKIISKENKMSISDIITEMVNEVINESISFSEPKTPKQEKEMLSLLRMLSNNRALEKGGWKQGAKEALEKAEQGDWEEAIMFLKAYIPMVLKRKKN